MGSRVRAWATLCGLAVLLIGSLFVLPVILHAYSLPNEVSLPILAIAGVLVLLGGLALVAVSFTLMNMSNPMEALALPSGSIRAVIALSLVVLFAILTVFLYSSLQRSGKLQSNLVSVSPTTVLPGGTVNMRLTGSNLNSVQHARIISDSTQIVGSGVVSNSSEVEAQFQIPLDAPVDKKWDVIAEDSVGWTAKLAAAISVTGPGATQDSPFVLLSVRPSSAQIGSALNLNVAGSNLTDVKQMRLVSGRSEIAGASLSASQDSVQAQFQIPASATAGSKWDVVVSDLGTRSANLPEAVTFVSAGTQRLC